MQLAVTSRARYHKKYVITGQFFSCLVAKSIVKFNMLMLVFTFLIQNTLEHKRNELLLHWLQNVPFKMSLKFPKASYQNN